MHTGKKVSTFRERFCEITDESGKTTVEIAKELQVANQTVSAWRTGVRSPKSPTVIAIAKHFNVDVAWLMGFDVRKEADEPSIVIPDTDLFRKIIVNMDQQDYETVMKIFEKTEIAMKAKGIL